MSSNKTAEPKNNISIIINNTDFVVKTSYVNSKTIQTYIDEKIHKKSDGVYNTIY